MRLQPHDFAAFASCADLFAPCHGKRLFLTGGTGFFGKWILESFLYINKLFGLNAGLTFLSRDPCAFLTECPWLKNESSVTFIQGDVRTFLFPPEPHAFVIHAAPDFPSLGTGDNSTEPFSVTVAGTHHVLEFASLTGATHVMLTSSGAVYGPQPPDLNHIPDDFRGTPQTTYGKGKLLAEQLCVDAGDKYGFLTLLPRCFAFVGPYLPLDAHFAIGNFIRDCLENRPIVIQGDGTPFRSYLYAADLAEWLWTILLRGEHARAYNVGSDQAISICDLAHLVRECAGTQNEIVIQGKKVEGLLPQRYVPSIERSKTELGLVQRVSLSDAIRRTIAWHRQHYAC